VNTNAAAAARPGAGRRPASRVRRISERLLLGSVMTLIAMLVDHRLRRVFAKQQPR